MKQFLCNVGAALATVAVMWLLLIMAADTPRGFESPKTGECLGVWDNRNMLSPCDAVARYDLAYAPWGVETPEQLAVYLEVQLSPEFSKP